MALDAKFGIYVNMGTKQVLTKHVASIDDAYTSRHEGFGANRFLLLFAIFRGWL